MSESIAIALIGLVGLIVSAVLGPILVIRQGRANKEAIEDKLGVPNGHGNVVQMLTTLLDGQTGQDRRLASIESRLHRGDEKMSTHGHQLDAIVSAQADLDYRVQTIESSCQALPAIRTATEAIAEHTDTQT